MYRFSELLDFVQRQVVVFRNVSVDNNGDKWWTYVDGFDSKDEYEDL
jgi:GTP-dependent phosphoenolpyruvate carboxykinase